MESELKTKPAFERYLQALLDMVKAEDKTTKSFDQGYAFGKAIARTTKSMTQSDKGDFQDGLDVGLEIEKMHKDQVH